MLPHGVVFVIMGFAFCQAAPTANQDPTLSPEDQAKAEEYLSQFYTRTAKSRSASLDHFATRLESMQNFFGLEVTGKLDSNTLEVMKKPRCGVSDVSNYEHFNGKPKWNKSIITYRITEYTLDLSPRQVDATIAQAFKLYSEVIPLDFKQIFNGTADIMILFKGRYHGDYYPFDGPGGVLAHANSPGPNQGGDTHFDEDEQWTLGQTGINLLLVAAHEFGHALGLDHSRDPNALMYPTYRYVDTRRYTLPQDDRRGVQALYGVRTPTVNPDPKPKPNPPKPGPQPEPTPNPKSERCSRDLVFDAVTSIRRELYFFKNGRDNGNTFLYYWKKSGLFNGVQFKSIQSTWPSISSVDAAYENTHEDVAYFFQGKHFWATKGTTMQLGYPKPISNLGFPSWVRAIDSAVYEASTRKTLFFVKNMYWSYNEAKRKMDRGFPRYIMTDFPGIGARVDAAFQNYGYLYFSEGPRQTEYIFRSKKIKRVFLNYGWLNCY
ncbi:collagenase 3-like [Arapaima gigas]